MKVEYRCLEPYKNENSQKIIKILEEEKIKYTDIMGNAFVFFYILIMREQKKFWYIFKISTIWKLFFQKRRWKKQTGTPLKLLDLT